MKKRFALAVIVTTAIALGLVVTTCTVLFL